MKSSYLMPHGARKYGFVIVAALLLIPLIWGNVKISFYAIYLFDFIYDVVTNKPDTPKQISYYIHTPDYWLTIQGIFLIIGAMLILFSKEIIEDEYTAKTRLESLLWACRTVPYTIALVYLSNHSLTWIEGFFIMGIYFPFLAFLRFKFVLYRNLRNSKRRESDDINKIKSEVYSSLLFDRKFIKLGYLFLVLGLSLIIYIDYIRTSGWITIPNFALIDYIWDFLTLSLSDVSNYIGKFDEWKIYHALFILGFSILILSKEKDDDEYIMQLRLDSFLWAFYANAIFLIIANLTVWGFSFLSVWEFEFYAVPLLTLLRFKYLLYKSKRNLLNCENN